jgi:integrase
VDEVFRSSIMITMAKSTRDRYESVLGKYLIPDLGDYSLVELSPANLQRYLSSNTRLKLSDESIDKIRDVLSSVLGSAVSLEYLTKNSAKGLKIGRPKKGHRSKPYITPEQFTELLARIKEPYASMVFVAVYTGLRVSEIVGLRWQDIHADSITIDERYCRGEWGAPKSDASNATIPVNTCVIERIHRLKRLTVQVRAGLAVRRYPAVKSDGPEDLVFQSPMKGVEMRDNNVLCRHIKPAARELQIPWVNWQVLRRSHATWLKMSGADIKDAQAQMRHSRAATTLEIYTQFVPESQRRAVDKLSTLPGLVN